MWIAKPHWNYVCSIHVLAGALPSNHSGFLVPVPSISHLSPDFSVPEEVHQLTHGEESERHTWHRQMFAKPPVELAWSSESFLVELTPTDSNQGVCDGDNGREDGVEGEPRARSWLLAAWLPFVLWSRVLHSCRWTKVDFSTILPSVYPTKQSSFPAFLNTVSVSRDTTADKTSVLTMLTSWRIRKVKKGSANSDSTRTSPKVKQGSDTVRGRECRVCAWCVCVCPYACLRVCVLVCVCFLSLVHAGYMEDIWA